MAGINKLLYGEKTEEVERVLTKKQVMEILNIKDPHVFSKLVKEDNLPHAYIGNKIVIPVNAYNKWLRDKTIP